MVEALSDPVTRVRRDAVRSLGQIGPSAKEAAAAVRKLLTDPEQMVREAASAAWIRITGEEVPAESAPTP